MARLLFLVVLAGCLAVAGTGRAQSVGAFADTDDLVERSEALEEAGDWEGALEIYRELRKRMGDNLPWGIAARHSAAAEELGRYAEAATMLRHAMAKMPPPETDADPPEPSWEQRMDALLRRVGRLRLVVEPKGAEVSVDGTTIGPAPIDEEVFVMPGSHEVVVARTGYETLQRSLSVVPGKKDTARFTLTARREGLPARLVPPEASRSTADDEGMSAADWGRIVGVGVGAAGIVAAVIMGIAYSSRDDKAAKLREEAVAAGGAVNTCGEGSPLADSTCKKLGEELQARDNLGTAAIAAGVGGGLVLTAGLLSLIISAADDDDDDETDVSFAPTVGGAVMWGRF